MNVDAIERAAAAVANTAPELGVIGVLLVGSYARSEQCPRSDIDLIVMVDRRTKNVVVQEQFRSTFAKHGIAPQTDVVVLERAELLRPHSLFITTRQRMRFLDVPNGSRLLYGSDFRGLLQPPLPTEVLRYLLGCLPDGPGLDEQDVLMAALAEFYAQTRDWTTKARLAASSEHRIVRSAWEVRCGSAGARHQISQAAAERFIQRARGALSAALAGSD